jgi:hypothetical protein
MHKRPAARWELRRADRHEPGKGDPIHVLVSKIQNLAVDGAGRDGRFVGEGK